MSNFLSCLSLILVEFSNNNSVLVPQVVSSRTMGEFDSGHVDKMQEGGLLTRCMEGDLKQEQLWLLLMSNTRQILFLEDEENKRECR